MTPDDKSPVDQALDLFVYAPVGLALMAKELLPGLVEKGREKVTGQVTVARMMGQFAVQQGQVEANKLLQRMSAPSKPTTAPPAPQERPTTAPAPAATAQPADAQGDAAANGAPPAARLSADDLAIPGYDSLSANQVVPRLAGLSADELERVRRYEAGHRGRKTILSRIGQLQAAG